MLYLGPRVRTCDLSERSREQGEHMVKNPKGVMHMLS